MAEMAYLGGTSPPLMRSVSWMMEAQSGSSNSCEVAFSSRRSKPEVDWRNMAGFSSNCFRRFPEKISDYFNKKLFRNFFALSSCLICLTSVTA